MRLLIAIILFASAAYVPQPNSPSKNIEQDSQGDTKPSPGKSIQDTPHSDGSQNEGRTDEERNQNPSVTIKEVPPIGVKKDGWDISNTVLTMLLVLVGGFSFGAVMYQAVQTRKAAQASKISADAAKQSAEAALRSVKLQEAQLEQWVSTSDEWESSTGFVWPGSSGTLLKVLFAVENQTKMALTLHRVRVNGAGEQLYDSRSIEHTLMPEDDPYPVEFGKQLGGPPDISDFMENKYYLPIEVIVDFRGAIGVDYTQTMSYGCTFGKSARPLLDITGNRKVRTA